MKKRRSRAIEKAKLPHEKVELSDDLKFTTTDTLVVSPVSKVTLKDAFGETAYEGYTLNVDIAREDKDLTVTSPYTTPTPPPGHNFDNLISESTKEITKVETKSALVKVKDLFKGIFKR